MVSYLITSGNSRTGKATIKHLKKLGETNIIAGARDPAASEKELKEAGAASVVHFDFTKPETVAQALKGVDRVLIVHGSTDFANYPIWAKTVADAAKQPGSTVKVLARISGYQQDNNGSFAAKLHGQAFQVLQDSGLVHFTVGPVFFFENWDSQKPSILSGTVYGATDDVPVWYIAVDDIGAVAAAALKNPEKYNGRHLPIVGQSVREADILKAITDATGISAKYVNLSEEDYKNHLQKAGLPEHFIPFLVEMEGIKKKLGAIDLAKAPNALKEVLGREGIDAQQWAKDNAANFK